LSQREFHHCGSSWKPYWEIYEIYLIKQFTTPTSKIDPLFNGHMIHEIVHDVVHYNGDGKTPCQ